MRSLAVRCLGLLGVLALAAGCVPFGPSVAAGHVTPVGSVGGIHFAVLGSAPQVNAVMWSPSGLYFAFVVSRQQGTFVLGTTNPLRIETVILPNQRTITALTNHHAVVTSISGTKDWLYPLTGLSLGAPVTWTAPSNTYQQWVDTASGPAIVTGGQRPVPVALQWASGRHLSLGGGQIYVSADGRFGAVTGGWRGHYIPNPVSDAQNPSGSQVASSTQPIAIWDFGGRTPRRLETLHLPPVRVPESSIDTVAFSPNDRYVAVSVMSFDAPPPTPGRTFVYDVRTGRLLGTGPWGNGPTWSATSRDLWIGTAAAEGRGTDQVMAVDGRRLASWPDSQSRQLVGIVDTKTLLMDVAAVTAPSQKLEVWTPATGTSLEVAQGSSGRPFIAWDPSPSGSAALTTVGSRVLYASWSLKHPPGS